MLIREDQINFIEFFDSLSKSAEHLSREERQAVILNATVIADTWSGLKKGNKKRILQELGTLKGHPDAYNGMIIESLLYHCTGDTAHLRALESYFPEYKPDFIEAAGTLNSIASMLFLANPLEVGELEEIFTRQFRTSLFYRQLEILEDLYQVACENKNRSFEKNNTVVVLTPQFLGPPHAPSTDALRFSEKLIKDYGKTIVLISTSLVSEAADGALAPAFLSNRNEEIMQKSILSWNGCNIPFLACGNGVFSEIALIQCMKAIDALSPEMILCVGEPGVLAEPFHERSFGFIYPLGHGLPLAKHNYFQLYADPSVEQRIAMEREGIEDKYLFTHQYDLELKPPSNSLTRAQFSIPEDSFVFSIVGMRLHVDVDTAFLNMLEKIAEDSNAHFLFAGYFDSYEERLAPHAALHGRSSWIGFQNDIMAVHNISDVFVNPARSGGGTGVVYALQAELPVLSLSVGDGGLVTKSFPEIRDYEHMAEIALKLLRSQVLLQQYQKISREEAPKFSGGLVSRIVAEFEKFAQRRLS